MVATLTRIFGLEEHLTLAEDVVQEALAAADLAILRGSGKSLPPGSCGLRAISRSMSSGAKRFSARKKPRSSIS